MRVKVESVCISSVGSVRSTGLFPDSAQHTMQPQYLSRTRKKEAEASFLVQHSNRVVTRRQGYRKQNANRIHRKSNVHGP